MNLQAAAASIAADVAAEVGFDPISIITILLPLLAQCWQQQNASDSPREYLLNHYDESSGGFDEHLVRRTRSQTRKAARQDGKGHLKPQALDQITVATFKKAMEEDESEVASVMAACAA